MAEWPTVRLPKEMMDEVERFTNTRYAKQNGFTSKSQVIVAAVRDFLKKYLQNQIRVITSSSNHVTIIDNRSESPIFVERKNKKIKCSEDGLLKNEKPCIHMVLSLYETQFFNTVKKNGLLSDFGKDYNEKDIEITQLFLKFYDVENSHSMMEVKETLENSNEIQEIKKIKTKRK